MAQEHEQHPLSGTRICNEARASRVNSTNPGPGVSMVSVAVAISSGTRS